MPCTSLGTTTPNLGLCKPAAGETNWTAAINGNWDTIDSLPITANLVMDQLTGVGLTYVSASSVTVGLGAAASDDVPLINRVIMAMNAGITGTTGGTWVVGTGQPKLDTGTVGNNTYHVFVIKRPDTGVTDILFSLSATAPSLPTNYTKQRRIASFLREGGSIVAFVQDGDLFQRNASVLDINATNPGSAAVTATLSVPVGVNVTAIINVGAFESAAQSVAVHVSDLATNDEAPSETAAPLFEAHTHGSVYAGVLASGRVMVRTNTSAQIRYRLQNSSAATVARIATLGWLDRRGRG